MDRHTGEEKIIPIVRPHIGPEPVTLDEYRLRHALYKTDPDLQAAHASAAFLMTYDDHEFDNNWAGDHDQDGSTVEEFLQRRAAAMQAWYENMSVRRSQLPCARISRCTAGLIMAVCCGFI